MCGTTFSAMRRLKMLCTKARVALAQKGIFEPESWYEPGSVGGLMQ